MTVSIRQLHPHFFGEVSGVDLRKPLTPQEAADIEAGMDEFAVLLFRDQDITDDQQLAFARNFGERENARGGTVTKKEDYRLTSGLNDVSNLGKDGKPYARDHRTHLLLREQEPGEPQDHRLGRQPHRLAPGAVSLREEVKALSLAPFKLLPEGEGGPRARQRMGG